MKSIVELKVDNVTFYYQKSDSVILQNCTINFTSGSIIGLVGLNGSGKSTFLKLLSGIITPRSGKIHLDQVQIKNLKSAKVSVTFLPENAKLYLLGPTVLEEFLHYFKSKEEILQILDQYGLSLLIDRKIYELSEGQRRLIALISAFQQKKQIFLLDEPTIGLDTTGRKILFELIQKIKKENGIVIVATNDNRVLPRMDKIVGLQNGNFILNTDPQTALPKLQENLGIVPNQIARLVADLREKNIIIPDLIELNGFNEYLKSLED